MLNHVWFNWIVEDCSNLNKGRLEAMRYIYSMKKSFLYASTVSYNELVFNSAKHDLFSKIFSLSRLVYGKRRGLLWIKTFDKIYFTLCRNQKANKFVNRHFNLGLWQFYLPIRNRIIKIKLRNIDALNDGDLSEYKLDEVQFEENKIDGVIHCAGYKSVKESIIKSLEYYDNNYEMFITRRDRIYR